MADQIPTATLLVSKTYQDADAQADFDNLARSLSTRLNHPVVPFPIDQPHQSLTDILTALLRHGIARIITLPVFLSPDEYQHHPVADPVVKATRRWPFVQHHLSPPLDWAAWLELVEMMVDEARGSMEQVREEETAVVLVGHGNASVDTNSDLAKLSRLFYEAQEFGWVDVAFVRADGVGADAPTVGDLIDRYQTLGARQIIVVPYMLFDGRAYQHLLAQVEAAQAKTCVASPLSSQPALIDLLLVQHQTALADTSLLPLTRVELEAEILAAREVLEEEQAVPSNVEADEFQLLKSKIDAILPPRYQGRIDEVSATPMSAADLVFDAGGVVLWDQIFGVDDPNNPYCELALAGGPSHRGQLLEAVSGAACLAEPGKYAAALEECGRGIKLITGLNIVECNAPGWIGVQCDSEAMAIWLMRAIIVENVMVRRQGDVIFLPVGPHYTLKDQIKSIVTVTAKTWHYWIEHIAYQEAFRAARMAASKLATPATN